MQFPIQFCRSYGGFVQKCEIGLRQEITSIDCQPTDVTNNFLEILIWCRKSFVSNQLVEELRVIAKTEDDNKEWK